MQEIQHLVCLRLYPKGLQLLQLLRGLPLLYPQMWSSPISRPVGVTNRVFATLQESTQSLRAQAIQPESSFTPTAT